MLFVKKFKILKNNYLKATSEKDIKNRADAEY